MLYCWWPDPSLCKTIFSSIWILAIKTRRSWDRFIILMGGYLLLGQYTWIKTPPFNTYTYNLNMQNDFMTATKLWWLPVVPQCRLDYFLIARDTILSIACVGLLNHNNICALSAVVIIITGSALNIHVTVRLNGMPDLPWISMPNSVLYCHCDDWAHPFLTTKYHS